MLIIDKISCIIILLNKMIEEIIKMHVIIYKTPYGLIIIPGEPKTKIK